MELMEPKNVPKKNTLKKLTVKNHLKFAKTRTYMFRFLGPTQDCKIFLGGCSNKEGRSFQEIQMRTLQ